MRKKTAAGAERRLGRLGCGSEDSSTQAMFPDPVMTADLYCSGRLDEAICRVAAPFWADFSALYPAGQPFLWLVRYWRRGEHLKLRVHAPPERRERAREMLMMAAKTYFHALTGPPHSAEPMPKPGRDDPTLIDEEDGDPAAAADRNLLWTRYRRSPVLLGDEALLGDDGYVARIERCFGGACELAMGGLRVDERGACPHGVRQSALIQAVVAGLAGACASPAERRAYLAFHRDWIVRYPVLLVRCGNAKAEEVLALLEHGASQAGKSTLAGLGAMVEQAWSTSRPDCGGEGREDAWRRSLRDLRTYLSGFGDPAYTSDPFAEGPLFPALFKVFHQLANQLGVKTLDEGLAYHLLLQATAAPGEIRRFVLVPAPLEETAAGEDAGDSRTHPLDASYPWNYLVSLASTEGRLWVERFLEQQQKPLDWTNEALRLLRAHELGDDRLSKAAALLGRAAEETRALVGADPAAYGVFGRFYFGTLAYYHYCYSDFELASRALDHANSCLVAAVHEQRCLLPATPLNADLPLQKARIALRRRLWREMALHLGELRDMQADRQPLCVLEDGTPVYYRTLGSVFAAAGELTTEQQKAVGNLLDKSQRLRAVNRRIQQLYTPPHLLIWYR